MKEEKGLALVCFLSGISIILLINSLLFMTIAKDLSEKFKFMKKEGVIFIKKMSSNYLTN